MIKRVDSVTGSGRLRGRMGGRHASAFAASGASSQPVRRASQVATTLDGLSLTGVVGVDMPLGLLADGWRDADALARRALGRRGVTVFAIPPRPVWQQPSYAEANRCAASSPARACPRRRGACAASSSRPTPTGARRPRALRGPPRARLRRPAGAPLAAEQAHPGRPDHRRELLAGPASPCRAKIAGAAENDLLDAAAVAWSARRIAAGRGRHPHQPRAQPADDATEIAIRY